MADLNLALRWAENGGRKKVSPENGKEAFSPPPFIFL